MRIIALAAAFTLLAACSPDIQNKDAVRDGIMQHLKASQAQTGLDIEKMQVDVGAVTFTAAGKEAHANVKFTPREGGAGMDMPYTLDRKGNKWEVRGKSNPHGAAALPALPANHPPVDKK